MMFASKIARPQTKSTQNPTAGTATSRPALAKHRLGYRPVEQAGSLQRVIDIRTPLWLFQRGTGSEASTPISDHEQERDGPNAPPVSASSGTSGSFAKIVLSTLGPTRRAQLSSGDGHQAAMQPKLLIGSVDDPLEREADRVADEVIRMPDWHEQVTSSPVQTMRKCAACEEDDKKKLQMRPSTAPASGAVDALASVQDVLASSGQPLDATARAYLEPRFGHDFSRVRVHTNDRAAKSAQSIGASAYTTGSDIVFAAGQYDPGSRAGRHLLAHELTHTIQQRASFPKVLRQADDRPDPDDAGAAPTASLEDRATRPASKAVIHALNSSNPEASGGIEIGNFPEAYRILNSLAMFDILATLDELKKLGELQVLRDHTNDAIGVDLPRIEVGIAAVADRTTITQKGWSPTQGEAFAALPPEQQKDVTDFLGATPNTQATAPLITAEDAVIIGVVVGALAVGVIAVIVVPELVALAAPAIARVGAPVIIRVAAGLAAASGISTAGEGAVLTGEITAIEAAPAAVETASGGARGVQVLRVVMQEVPATVTAPASQASQAVISISSSASSIPQAAIITAGAAAGTLSSDSSSAPRDKDKKEKKSVCDTETPTGELTSWIGWGTDPDYATIGMWRQQLLPLTTDFSGCEVFETDPGGGTDSCWYNYSAIFPYNKVSGGPPWIVEPGNYWKTDYVGWHDYAVDFYRKDGRAPCGSSFLQSMHIRRPSGGDQEYARNQLAGEFDANQVSSSRAGQTEIRNWP
ncbi:DUF4157 domain-containing protein [Paraburkholderia fynbosensis]|nr:DUF4157 domain-containing protein [Paraburkholderia fynbosensis]